METYYSLIYLTVSLAIAVCAVLLVLKLRNSKSALEAKLTGIWVNETQTMRILLHHIDSVFQADVVWINSLQNSRQYRLGAQMIKGLALKPMVQGSTGVYINPDNGTELPFKMWFQGNGILKFAVIDRVNGKNQVVKEERWFQL